jgi:hypothetical protein
MHAYISLTRKRNDGRRPYLTVPERQIMALREARAILAETEPIPEGFSQANRMHRITVSEIAAGAFTGDTFPALWTAEKALTEALEAFIKEEN